MLNSLETGWLNFHPVYKELVELLKVELVVHMDGLHGTLRARKGGFFRGRPCEGVAVAGAVGGIDIDIERALLGDDLPSWSMRTRRGDCAAAIAAVAAQRMVVDRSSRARCVFAKVPR